VSSHFYELRTKPIKGFKKTKCRSHFVFWCNTSDGLGNKKSHSSFKVQLIGFYDGTVGLAEKELRISLTAIRELVVQIQLSFIAVSRGIP
jgi:hypothetical protein